MTLTPSIELPLTLATTILDAVRANMVETETHIEFNLDGRVMGELIDADLIDFGLVDIRDLSDILHPFIRDFVTSNLCMLGLVSQDWDLLTFAIAGRVAGVLQAKGVKLDKIARDKPNTIPWPRSA